MRHNIGNFNPIFFKFKINDDARQYGVEDDHEPVLRQDMIVYTPTTITDVSTYLNLLKTAALIYRENFSPKGVLPAQ